MTPAAPAGFWRRYAAYTLDFTALGACATLLSWPWLLAGWHASTGAATALTNTLRDSLVQAMAQGPQPDQLYTTLLQDPAVRSGADAVQSGLLAMLLPWLATYAVIAALYHIAFERSGWQGSPGKHALALRVVDARTDGPTTPGQTVMRHVGGALSWLTLNLGHALAALPPQRRALHDYMAGARVVSSDATAPLPTWARAWLWLQVLVIVVALAWLVQRDVSALQASLG
ncbi:RDD family protein [Cognatiluteimonas profundi]|uniref:RDD family protein n=1 Tax=Cognatiluteimonas profundi TaxID=2594501 RepID=UPI00131C019C|nr:RDD family protein [Lysobacter profundi]